MWTKEQRIKWRKQNKSKFQASKRNLATKKRKQLRHIKITKGCAHCGENHPACLEFHHQGNKEGELSRKLWAWGIDRLLAEAQKCIVLCANCHKKLHYGHLK